MHDINDMEAAKKRWRKLADRYGIRIGKKALLAWLKVDFREDAKKALNSLKPPVDGLYSVPLCVITPTRPKEWSTCQRRLVDRVRAIAALELKNPQDIMVFAKDPNNPKNIVVDWSYKGKPIDKNNIEEVMQFLVESDKRLERRLAPIKKREAMLEKMESLMDAKMAIKATLESKKRNIKMKTETSKNPAAVALGRIKSPAKAAASRANLAGHGYVPPRKPRCPACAGRPRRCAACVAAGKPIMQSVLPVSGFAHKFPEQK